MLSSCISWSRAVDASLGIFRQLLSSVFKTAEEIKERAASPTPQCCYSCRWHILPHSQDHLQTFAPAKMTKNPPQIIVLMMFKGLTHNSSADKSTPASNAALPISIQLYCSVSYFSRQELRVSDRAMSENWNISCFPAQTPLRQPSTAFQK